VSLRQLLSWLGVEETRDAHDSTPLRELIETAKSARKKRARWNRWS
jgi:hypothetical protein